MLDISYLTIPPPPSLANIVRYFWVLEGKGSIHQPYVHRTLASACAELVFNYKGSFDQILPSSQLQATPLSSLQAPTQQISRYRIQEDFGILGAYLYPHAIPCLFKVPTSALSNMELDLTELVGNEVVELIERIFLASSNHQRIHLLCSFFEKRLKKSSRVSKGIDESIRSIINNSTKPNIRKLAEQSFLSLRQFERKFKAAAGFTPKTFSRIARFQTALSYYQSEYSSLAEIAYSCGYYDQSHFIHDFKHFSGHSPKDFFAGKVESMEWREGQ